MMSLGDAFEALDATNIDWQMRVIDRAEWRRRCDALAARMQAAGFGWNDLADEMERRLRRRGEYTNV